MDSIKASINIIENQIKNYKITNTGIPFDTYQKVYLWTNENINGYLSDINPNISDIALSVMASGDHTFNLITNGVLNIDTFDTNVLTEYYVLGLKRAMVLKYNYNEFISVMNKLSSNDVSIEESTNIIYELLPYMDSKYRKYWLELNDKNYKLQREYNTNFSIFHLLFINILDDYKYLKSNNYLINEDNYNKLKDNIVKSNISFMNADALRLHESFKKKYNYILLSNILDYFYKTYGFNWGIDKLNEYIKSLESMSSDHINIFLNYIFMYSGKNYTRSTIINSSSIKNTDIINSEIILVDNINNKSKDGVIILK